jgi:hypothetical protein
MSQKNPTYLKFTPEEEARIAKAKERDEGKRLPLEWRLIGEFGFYYGWNAVMAVRNNEIDQEEFNLLLSSARSVHAQHVIDHTHAVYTGTGAAQTKNPNKFINDSLVSFKKEVTHG